MGQITVAVSGREYTLACDDGEEQHLAELAQYLDSKVHFLVEQIGPLSDMRLMLMAGLLIADELWDVRSRLEALEDEVEALRRRGSASSGAQTQQAALLLDSAAQRLEDIASRLEAP